MSTSLTTAVGPGEPWYDTGPVNVGTLHAAVASTIVWTTAKLSAGVSSSSFDVTPAAFVINPATGAVADNVIVAACPGVRLPTTQTTCPAAIEHVPCDETTLETLRPAGTGSTTIT